MKNLGLTFLIMLFVGVGASMAQDKKAAADSDAAAPVKTEISAEKAHKCAADCTKVCCAKKADGRAASDAPADKKSCAPSCEKACCTADAGKAKDEKHNHPH
jgi:hypothetical protein